jgi:antitoxin (DNA-binding transcriptional repressor) of toxin-antitoxin stability system
MKTTGFSANLPLMKATPLEPEIITRKGKPVSVILPIKKYADLLERVEDAEDIAWLRRARQKPLSYRPLEEYIAEREKKRRV